MGKLKLLQKGIIVVSIPLVVGLSLFAVLGYLLHISEHEEKIASHSKVVISEAEELMKQFYDAMTTLYGYGLTKSDLFLARFAEISKKIPKQTQRLNDLIADDHSQSENAQEINKLSAMALVLLNKFRSALDEEDQIDIFKEINHYQRRQTETQVGQLMADLHKVVEHERDIEKRTPLGSAQIRDQLKFLLIVGIILNLILTLSLGLFFTKSIVKRLDTLIDNSLRLAANRPLNPPLKGGDEIARLDGVFHAMAETLTEAMRKERAIIDNASDVICSIHRKDGVFTNVSPASTAAWGYHPDELIGSSYKDIVTDETRKQTEEAFENANTSRTGVRFENRVRRKNGPVIDVLWSIQSSPAENSIFCVAHDITARKELDRLKQQFLQMVTHDLRTPLATAKIFLQMLSEGTYGQLPEPVIQRSVTVSSNVSRLITMVNNLLDIEKLESNRLSMVFEDCSVKSLIDRSIEAVTGLAEEKKIRIATPSIPQDVRLKADEERLIQVLVNLLSNAIKFSPSDSVVSVKVTELDNDLKIRVDDTGRGIPKQFREIIFDRFQQVDVDDALVEGGSGLGLALSKAIVEEHGGTIGVDSEEGKGSSFWFRLPKIRSGES